MPKAEPRLRPPPQSRLKLAQLRLVAAIEDCGSVSAAAQALNMSQPAASRLVAEVEAAFGASLCERLARGVRLTPVGAALARHARSVLLQLAEAERELGDLKEGRRGAVFVGAVSGPAFDVMPAAVLEVRARAPEIELSVKIDSSNVLARDLLAGRLDLMLARVPDDLDADEFDAYALGIEEARLIVRRDHALLARGVAKLADVAAFEWVMQPRGTPLRRAIEGLFLAANLAPPRRLLATTSLTMTMMTVARADAIAAVSHEVARFVCEAAAPGALAVLPTAFSLVVQPFSLVSARSRPLSPAARTVYETVLRLAAGAR
ncbi:MAG TPA: LysR substrate-binding domain-containing protein [Roseiarcus sp.]|nr:LysR substrate-binding domain-containing protein [Roseiarcus sp.]